MSDDVFLVTGAYGCIGAWVVRELLDRGLGAVAFDAGDDPRRLALVLDEGELAALPRVRGDVTDARSLGDALDAHSVSAVVHLAALQVPFCRADPVLGAHVNVVGTVNVLEAVRARASRMRPLVYASSIAAYDALDAPGAAPAMVGQPSTLYGVYKRANEGTADVYWRDHGVSSLGLRPHTVFGPGRDQGLTSAPTSAMLAAALGRRYTIPYGGRHQFQYAPDVARAFVAAALSDARGASVHNLAGEVVDMAEVVRAIEAAAPAARGAITYEDVALPFPAEVDPSTLAAVTGPVRELPFAEGVADAVERFRALAARGLVA